jgi:hypothetical protein
MSRLPFEMQAARPLPFGFWSRALDCIKALRSGPE